MSETYSPSGTVGNALTRFTSAEAATGTFGTMDRLNVTEFADRTRYLSPTNGLFNFPATQVADAGANVLDDYEEGTWTPNITRATSGPTLTYTRQVGVYTKVGRLVTVAAYITINTISANGSGVNAVNGLPFTTKSSGRYSIPVAYNDAFSASNVRTALVTESDDTVTFLLAGPGTTQVSENWAAGGNLIFSFSYFV